MYLLDKGLIYAFFSEAKESGVWVGRAGSFIKNKEHLPFTINGKRFILEFVIPDHLLDSKLDPKSFQLDYDKLFLPQREYRILNLYTVDEHDSMEMDFSSEDFFNLKENTFLFITALRKSLLVFVLSNPSITQFFFLAKGAYATLLGVIMDSTDDVSKVLTLTKIDELNEPIYGFDIHFNTLLSNTKIMED